MKDYFYKKKKRNRRKDVVCAYDVEEMRIRFGLKKGEFAELMGISHTQYNNCEKKGGFLSFRVYAALDAIENVALNKAMKDVAVLHKIKSGMKLNYNSDAEEESEEAIS